MDDRVNRRVLRKDFIESLLVANINLVERRPLSAEELNSVNGLLRGVVEAVNDDDIIAGVQKLEGGEGANVARAAGCQESCQKSSWRGSVIACWVNDLPGNKNSLSHSDDSREFGDSSIVKGGWGGMPDSVGSSRYLCSSQLGSC